MRVRTTYDVEPSNVPALDLPLDLDVGEGVRALMKRQGDLLLLVVDYPVDLSALALEPNSGWQDALPNGERRNIPAVRVSPHAGPGASDVVAALTFLTDVALAFSLTGPAELVPDTDEDTKLLDEFRTRQVYRETRAQPGMRTFPEVVIDSDAIRALIPKTAGLRLYGDALAGATDEARYRDFWRVLESAFSQQSKQLVNTLASYPPARELGFTKDELQELKELRGGVSHGTTSSEEAAKSARVRKQRLKSLVERVILTKESWGTPDLNAEELTPATSWVGPDGRVILRVPQRDG